MAQPTGLATSRVPRLTQALERPHSPLDAWCWATADGRQGLTRLVVATRAPCGLTRGVGMDTRRAFVAQRPLETPRGGAPSAWRGVRQA